MQANTAAAIANLNVHLITAKRYPDSFTVGVQMRNMFMRLSFAIEVRHLFCRVPGTGSGTFGHCVLDCSKVLGGQRDLHGAQSLG